MIFAELTKSPKGKGGKDTLRVLKARFDPGRVVGSER